MLEPDYYYSHDFSFPSTGNEHTGWFVGPCKDIRNVLTYHILDAKSHKVVSRSNIQSAGGCFSQNLWVLFPSLEREPNDDPTHKLTSTVKIGALTVDPSTVKLYRFLQDKLMGLSFLKELDDG